MKQRDIMKALLHKEEVQIAEYNYPDYGLKRLFVAEKSGLIELIIRNQDGSLLEEFALQSIETNKLSLVLDAAQKLID